MLFKKAHVVFIAQKFARSAEVVMKNPRYLSESTLYTADMAATCSTGELCTVATKPFTVYQQPSQSKVGQHLEVRTER